MATASKSDKAAERFFNRNAGFCYDPKTETPKQGRARCARELAKAEQWAKDNGVTFLWSNDNDGYYEAHAEGRDAAMVEECCAYFPEGVVPIAQLCGIEDATDEYRRVVEAELALEAMSERQAIEARNQRF